MAEKPLFERWTVWFALIAVTFALGLGGRLLMEQTNPQAVAADLGAPFSLTDYNGASITQAAFEGQPSVLFFGFTHCPEICPTTVYELESWLIELGPDAEKVNAFFITIDPERDTPEILADYLKPQSDRVVGISGAPDEVFALADAWRVYYNKVPLDDGDYTMDHTTLLYLLNDKGEYHGLIRYGTDYDEAVAKLRELIAS